MWEVSALALLTLLGWPAYAQSLSIDLPQAGQMTSIALYPSPPQGPGAGARYQVRLPYGKPLASFQANRGQPGAQVEFLPRGLGYIPFVTSIEAALDSRKPQAAVWSILRRAEYGFAIALGADPKDRGDNHLMFTSLERAKEGQELVATDAAPQPADQTGLSERQARGSRYDGRGTQPLAELPGGERVLIVHPRPLPPLPVSQSDAVVLGEVLGAQPYLSNDGTSIYTEFVLRVERVFKNDDRMRVIAGSTAVVVREGGALRLPSGRLLRFSIDKLGLPRVRGRYVLFLERDDQGKDFRILRLYELREGHVFPLDTIGPNGGARLPLAGSDETTFLNMVQDAVAHP